MEGSSRTGVGEGLCWAPVAELSLPPLHSTNCRFWFRGQKCRNMGLLCLVHVTAQQVPQNTCCRHEPTLPFRTTKGYSTSQHTHQNTRPG